MQAQQLKQQSSELGDQLPSSPPAQENIQQQQQQQQQQGKSEVAYDSADRLQSILARAQEPLSQTNLNIQVKGIYSLPEAWVQKSEEGTDTFTYQLKICGFQMKAGKICPRQRTEEEKKAQAEVAAQKGKKPGKQEKKEISPEQQEALDKANKERELQEKLEAEQWDQLTEEEKFFKTSENHYKKAWFQFSSQQNVQSQDLSAEPLVVLQQQVNDEHGVYLEFNKLPPAQDQLSAPAGKKPAKGKGAAAAATQVQQPTFGRAWIDFSNLRNPGGCQVEGRFLITTHQPPPTSVAPTPEPGEDKKEGDQVPPPPEPIFEQAKTYVILKLTLSNPVNPPISEHPLPSTHDIVQNKPPKQKFPTGIDATGLYKMQIQTVIKSLNHEYEKQFRDELQAEKKAKPSEEKLKHARQARKQRFLYDFNTSGKYHVLKEKLKKTIVRIVKDKYKKSENAAISAATSSMKGVSATERDQFYSELYAYLLEQMHHSVDKVIFEKRNELHEELVIPHQQARKERDRLIESSTKQSRAERNLRLVMQYQVCGKQDLAQKYLQDELNARNGQDIDLWLQYARFNMRHGRIQKAEECMREVIGYASYQAQENQTITEEQQNEYFMMFGALMATRGRYKQAAVFIKQILESKVEGCNTASRPNLLLALIYERAQREGLTTKHIAIAKRQKMRQLSLLPPKGQSKSIQLPERGLGRYDSSASFPNPSTSQRHNDQLLKQITLPAEHSNTLFLDLANFLLSQNFYDLAAQCLGYVTDSTSIDYLFANAKVAYQQKEYKECAGIIQQLLRKDSRRLQAWTLRGHAFYQLKNYFDCEECYIKAIRISTQNGDSIDPELQQKLGMIYIRRKSYRDAKVIFLRRVAEGVSANAWKNLGFALLKLDELSEAEQALTQANILDNLNADVWGLLSILCLRSGDKRIIQARQCASQAFKLNLQNAQLLHEMGQMFGQLGDNFLGIECIQKGLNALGQNSSDEQEVGQMHWKIGMMKVAAKDRDGAIDAYKIACRYVKNIAEKERIAQGLRDLLQGTEREGQIQEFRQLLEQGGGGTMMEQEASGEGNGMEQQHENSNNMEEQEV